MAALVWSKRNIFQLSAKIYVTFSQWKCAYFARESAVYGVKVRHIWKNAAPAWICRLWLIMRWIMQSHNRVFLEGLIYSPALASPAHIAITSNHKVQNTASTNTVQPTPINSLSWHHCSYYVWKPLTEWFSLFCVRRASSIKLGWPPRCSLPWSPTTWAAHTEGGPTRTPSSPRPACLLCLQVQHPKQMVLKAKRAPNKI